MDRMMKSLLMVALVCGLSLNFTSCKDDDKDDSSDDGQEQLSEEQQEQNNAAYAILDNLADLSSANDNFLTQTFRRQQSAQNFMCAATVFMSRRVERRHSVRRIPPHCLRYRCRKICHYKNENTCSILLKRSIQKF